MGNPIDPEHYKGDSEIESIHCIRAMLGSEGFKAYCRGNVVKYLWRFDKKGKAEEDLAKARWYQEKLNQELQPRPPKVPEETLQELREKNRDLEATNEELRRRVGE